MRIIDILEAKDPATEWLKNYTYHNTDQWPNDYIISTLLKRFPNTHQMTLYRGMNFRSKESYDEYISQFTNGTATIEVSKISSWTNTENTAEHFAMVQPTYNPDMMTFHQEEKARKEFEKVRGYRGIIISNIIEPNTAIDVNKSKHAKENEFILPPATYTINIVKELKRYSDQINDDPSLIEKYILSLTKL